MGTTNFILSKTYFALISSIPSVIILVFFTDEFGQFFNEVADKIQISGTWAFVMVVFVITIVFLLVFLLHIRFIKKKTYSFLASTHVFIQFLIVEACFLLVLSFRQTLFVTNNLIGYLLIAFVLSVVISETSYLLNYIKAHPTHLIPIETLLAKNPKTEEESKPSFLRLGGFLWIDFHEHITVQRKETENIIERLKTEKELLLIGEQASGKSIILRDIGFQLSNKDFIVLFSDIESLNVDLALADIRNWDMSNVVVLIDDIHRNTSKISDFLNKVHSHNVRIILASRPTNFNVLREEHGHRLLDLFQKRTRIEVTEETIYDMIVKYAELTNLHFRIGKRKLSADAAKQVIQKCGTDLWLVTYLLAAWNPVKTNIGDIAKADIYQKVYDTRISRWRLTNADSLKAMQTVCALYQFEIPCSEKYLIELNINKTAIELALEGNLIKKDTYYFLPHPSVARIYMETLQHYHLIDNSTDLSIDILASYMEKNKEDRPQIFYKLSAFSKSLEKRAVILKGMLLQMNVDDIVHHVIQEENLEKIGFFFCSLSTIDKKYANKVLLKVGSESLTKKLLLQPFAKKQRNFIEDISQVNSEIGKLLAEKRPKISYVIPLHNEEKQITFILEDLFDFIDIPIVVDDCSFDGTSKKAADMGARVVRNNKSKGLLPSLLIGLKEAINQDSDIVIIDLFPWINRAYIPKLIAPIMKQSADLVVGIQRKHIDYNEGYTQAINRKGLMKFIKYLPSKYFEKSNSLENTSILFSNMLKVKTIDIKMMLSGFVIVNQDLLLHRRRRYYYSRKRLSNRLLLLPLD